MQKTDGQDEPEQCSRVIVAHFTEELKRFEKSRNGEHDENGSDCLVPDHPGRAHDFRHNGSRECLSVVGLYRANKLNRLEEPCHVSIVTVGGFHLFSSTCQPA